MGARAEDLRILLVLTCATLLSQAGYGQPTPAPAPAPDSLPSTLPSDSGAEQLAATIAATQQANSTPTFAPVRYSIVSSYGGNNVSLAPAPAPDPQGRRLLQDNTDIRNLNFDTTFEAQLIITDSKGNQGPFSVRPDTGSPFWTIQTNPPANGGYDASGAGPGTKSRDFNYDGSEAGGVITFSSNRYNVAFQFVGQKASTPSTLYAGYFTYPDANNKPTVLTEYQSPPFGLEPASPGQPNNPVDDMFDAGNLAAGVFTMDFLEYNPVDYRNNLPGGTIAFGSFDVPSAPTNQAVDLACNPSTYRWVVDVARFTATTAPGTIGPNSVDFCGPDDTSGVNCGFAVDSGSFSFTAPRAIVNSIYELLGVSVPGPPNQSRYTGRADSYPQIDCSVLANSPNYPTLDYQIGDRVYSLKPTDYIFQFSTTKTTSPTFNNNRNDICLVVITPARAGYASLIGDPFISKFKPSFLSQGFVGGSPQPNICFRGNVPVKAQCKPELEVTPDAACKAFLSEQFLLSPDGINLANTAVLSTTNPSTPSETKFSLEPRPDQGGFFYELLGGQTYTFTLEASNSAGTDSCSSFVHVTQTAPTVSCRPTAQVPANAGCAAQLTATDLQGLVVASSSPGTGDALTYTFEPAADSSGQYTLPVGTYPVSVIASNCAGTATCSTLVTVEDTEELDSSKIACGNLPANGVLSFGKDATTPQVYTPTYTKANGCSVEIEAANLICQNCFAGLTTQAEGSLDKCDSSVTSQGVVVGTSQVARVKWTANAYDAAGRVAVADCAICVEQVAGGSLGIGAGKCPSPFSATTACAGGKY